MRSGRDPFIPDRSYFLYTDTLPYIIQQFVTVNRPIFKTVDQNFLCTFNDLFSLDNPDVFDGFYNDMGNAGSDAIDRFEGSSEYGSLCPIKRRRD